jgi:hypothetical protein
MTLVIIDNNQGASGPEHPQHLLLVVWGVAVIAPSLSQGVGGFARHPVTRRRYK